MKGYPQIPLEGVSFRSTFESDDVPTPKETGFFSMLGSRAVWHKGWKAVSVHPTIAGWGTSTSDRWELYDTERGPDREPRPGRASTRQGQEMVNLWFHLAGKYNGLPLLDRTAVEVLGGPEPAAGGAAARPLHLLPGPAEVPESGRGQHPEPQLHRSRSRSRSTSEDAAGVLFSHGARFGGHALYVKDAS